MASADHPSEECVKKCNEQVVQCYSAAGLTFGTEKKGPSTPKAAWDCDQKQSDCRRACNRQGGEL